MKKEMLINVMQPEECRIAIVEDGVLEELYVERTSHESYVGNIYKGRIVNIEPSIQAAFVDFGVGRNGFLHVSDVEPAYYRHLESRRPDEGRRGGGGRDRDRGGRDRGFDRDRGRGGDRDRGRSGDRDRGRGSRRPPNRDEFDTARALDEDFPPEAPTPQAEAAPLDVGPAFPPTQPPAVDDFVREERPFHGSDREVPSETADDEAPRRSDPDPDSDRPRYMDSAERRTEKESYSGRDSSLEGGGEPFGRSIPEEPIPHRGQPDDAEFGRDENLPTQAEKFVAEFEDEPDTEADAAEDQADDALLDDLDEMDEVDEERLPPFDEDGEESAPRRGRGPGGPGRGDRRGGGNRRGPAGRPGFGRPKPLIQDIFKRGQEVLVQVIKEGIGTKGPTLSTYISIAGRYLVLMPGLNRVGVSRKIADDDARRRLREIFHELQPPKGLGFIIRTAGMDRTKKELQRDLAYLARLWQVVARRIRKIKAPAEIYRESDMITRTIRDTFASDIDTIYVDEPSAFEQAQEFMQVVMPRYANRIKHFAESEPLFHKYGIENEISRIQMRHVPLPSGGSIVIDQTEALVAIDVNSGNFRADNNAEETAYQMNLQAAKEIARQLRLRDLGGVIVNDFIDMREEKHRRGVERAMREAVRRDRARTKILKISQFGIIEMTRQRIRPSLKRSIYQDCPHCRSTGHVKTTESMSIDVMRMIQLAAHRPTVARVEVKVAEEVAHYLLNKKRRELARLEEAGEIQVGVTGKLGAAPEALEFTCYDNNNNEVKVIQQEEPVRHRRR
jgi:ribonuclease E